MRYLRTVFSIFFAIALIAAVPMNLMAATGDSDDGKSDSEKAKEAYETGVEHMKKANEAAAESDSTYAYNYRATQDAKASKQYEKAIDKFEKAVDLDDGMKAAWNNLGYCYRKIGDLERSLAAYQRALEIDENYAQAREYLGETYLALGNLDKAKEQLTKLQEMESPYADTLSQSIELYRLKELDKKMKDEG